MRYKGQKAPIPIGRGGLLTDMPPGDIPPFNLTEAKNIMVLDGTLQKDRGVRRWNRSPLSGGIVDIIEWSPVEARNYIYALTKDGNFYRFWNREEFEQLSASSDADPASFTISENNAFFIVGGEEVPNRDKKMFIFTRNHQIQVVVANSILYRTLQGPSADFSTDNFPRFGIIHRGRLIVFTNHRAYGSNPDDHEDFVGSGSFQTPVYPGEGDFLITGYVFRKKLFIFKTGGGVYQLIDDNPDTTNWYFERISDEFGMGAHRALVEAGGDLIGANDKGTLTSLRAVQEFGDVDLGDTFKIMKVKRFLANLVADQGLVNRRMLYDTKKQVIYAAHQPVTAAKNNAFWKIDLSQDRPQITLTDKEQVNCLAILSIPTGSKKPFYGADDGYIYELDTEDREIGLVFNPITPAAVLGSGAGSLDNATYRFKISFADASSESLWSAPTEEIIVSDNGVNGKIELTEIPIDTTSTATKRIVYGKKSADTAYTKVAEISDNTTTIFTVNSDPLTWTTVTEPSLNTFNTAYEMAASTPHLSMKHIDPRLEGINKAFEWLEIGFLSTGLFDIALEYWIDGIYRRSRTFKVAKGPILGDPTDTAAYQFVLNTDRLDARAIRWVRFKLYGNGRAIMFRFSNSGQKENGIITDMNAYFRISNEDQRAVRSGKAAS